jgi:hypothetical protein
MLLPIPRCSDCVRICSIPQPYQSSLKGRSGRPAHFPFRGLLGIHSRCGLHTRAATNSWHSLPEGFGHIVTSIAAPVATGWSLGQVGLAPTGKRRLGTAHAQSRSSRSTAMGSTAAILLKNSYLARSTMRSRPERSPRPSGRPAGPNTTAIASEALCVALKAKHV